jgi:hypothetical protein
MVVYAAGKLNGEIMGLGCDLAYEYHSVHDAGPEVIEFDGYSVELVRRRGSIHVTIHSVYFDVGHVTISVLNDRGCCLAKEITEENGSAVLAFGSSDVCYRLMIEWP